MNAEILRALMAGFIVAMFALAMLYLSRRQLTWMQIAAWGLIALLVPVLGPFLVIVLRPGTARQRAAARDARLRRQRDEE